MSSKESVTAAIREKTISEDEKAVYDRQIRLWGLETQNRLRNSTVLIAGLSGCGSEVAKNLMLTGLKSLTLLDSKTRAEASLQKCQLLNPNVELHVDTEDIGIKDEKFFTSYDLVILVDQTYAVINRISKIFDVEENNLVVLDDVNINFIAGGVFGWVGYAFFDFTDCSFLVTIPKIRTGTVLDDDTVEDGPSSLKRPRFNIELENGRTEKENKTSVNVILDDDDEKIQTTFLYPLWDDAWNVDWSHKKLIRKAKRILPRSYFPIRDGGDTISCEKFMELWKKELEQCNHVLDDEYFNVKYFSSFIGPQLSPACAIVGAHMAQEAIKIGEAEAVKPEKIIRSKTEKKDESNIDDSFVPDILPTREIYRIQLKIGIQNRLLTLLQGPIGCGKTSMVKEVARNMKLPCRTIQIGEQIDSKTLFGTFHCLDVPGEFCWKHSTFTKYILDKGIIVLEDIDCAPADLISQIIELCNNREVRIISGETIRMHSEAYVIATMRYTKQERNFRSADIELLLTSIPFVISLPLFTNEELHRAICILYKRVAPFARKLVTLFDELINSSANPINGRKLGAADLLKACARINDLNDLSDMIAILHELIDCWTIHCHRQEDVLALSEIIANSLSVNHEQLLVQLNLRLPDISVTRTELICGRVVLQRNQLAAGGESKVTRFGLTRDVCQLLERIAVCVKRMEPILLVGETGVGKTATVQLLADHVGSTLRVVNLSQHSDSSDLIGGYKPVSIPYLLRPMKKEYDELFAATFDLKKNEKFLRHLEMCLSNGRYGDYAKLIAETARRTVKLSSEHKFAQRWANLFVRAERCSESLKASAVSFAYAAERGEWLLVDEINLATPECLDSIVHLIENPESRHPDFRLFACMNPANDIGKRNIPAGIRSRFTEIFVRETTEIEELYIVARAYLPSFDISKISAVLELYQTLRATFPGKYSLRTLSRALAFTRENIFGNEARSLYEAISMSFMSDLDAEAQIMVEKLIQNKMSKIPLGKLKTKFTSNRIEIEGYWIEKGSAEPQDDPSYVCTSSVRKNLSQLARVVCSGKFPVLLEGETSCGKTAMVMHLAKITGNTIIRINNHEHTDLQEYIGSYVPDGDGRFVFTEGPLVKAARNGHWIILDELNLAPTDVIEALNRARFSKIFETSNISECYLLDDNRELFVSETNTVVKAHPQFRLFATQNPVHTYAGRKRLSRALLNRFVVLQFSQLPYDELAEMVIISCNIAPSAARAMVSVFCDLRAQRSAVGVFCASDGLITLRDLFRWGRRLAGSDHNDWRQCLAEHGFFLLASRCRSPVDVECVKKILETKLKHKINIDRLFASDSNYLPLEFRTCKAVKNIVLTDTIRRMLVLVSQSWHFDEPVLIIGETGCGKTTIAQMLAKEKLLALNCHERTEAADFLGSLRPVGKGIFRWIDGVIVQAMKRGLPLLIDEISLASDSVLERLNPLLEPSRSLFLNDGGVSNGEVQAKSGFNIIATMNPGGDYGKKELSKALRNRFTEIWCPSAVSSDDLIAIVDQLLSASPFLGEGKLRLAITKCVVHFVLWFDAEFSLILRSTITVRDIVAVAQLITATIPRSDSPSASIYHAFSASLFDAFGTLSTRVSLDSDILKKKATDELSRIMKRELDSICAVVPFSLSPVLRFDDIGSHSLIAGDFHIPFGPAKRFIPKGFTLDAPTCKQNIFRLARGLAINKPILLEGPPGCGKSSTVVALAAITGHPLTRLNLSEQTDLADLFGCDVPVFSSDDAPSFTWRDGPILHAIKTGQWVLLDEMNLASQSVLEGLNACFDHRHQLFIPELNRTFDIDMNGTKTRFFACQNPCAQGGNRRKLPKSFINRFTSMYVTEMNASDFFAVIKNSFGSVLDDDVIQRMVDVTNALTSFMMEDGQFLTKGSQFEFNLRDLLRWAQLTADGNGDVAYAFNILYVWRLRSADDRQKMRSLFRKCFKFECTETIASLSLMDSYVRIGKVELERCGTFCGQKNVKLLSSQMKLLDKLAACVKMNWLTLIVGKSGSGKSTTVSILASLLGKELHTIHLTSESDSLELLGSFEQVTNCISFASIKEQCLNLLKQFPNFFKDVKNAEDIFALRFAVQSAILLVDEDTGNKLTQFDRELSKSKMRFEWLNSRFVDAFINGHWILIKNVNCCSAAVLDRLNACLENNRELNLQECGDANSVVKAHNNFRVFFTMDEDYGGVSRAMRNRSVELYLLPNSCTWFNVEQDMMNVVMNTENQNILQIAPAVKQACQQLSCWELLKLKMLLKGGDINFESAIKHFKITVDEKTVEIDENNEKTFIVYPLVDANFFTKYRKWKILVWSYVSRHDWILGILWAALSISFKDLEVKNIIGLFNCSDEYKLTLFSSDKKAKEEVIEVIQNMEQNETLDYDERFDGSPILRITKPPETYLNHDRFIIRMCTFWAKSNLDKISIEKESAIDMSNLFAKRKIRSDQLPSTAISHLKELLDEIYVCITKFSPVDHGVLSACLTLWNVVLFVEACYRQMDIRSACAPLHLIWQQLNDLSYFKIWKKWSAGLCRVANAVDEVWMIDKEESECYAIFYKRCNFFETFTSYSEWRKYEEKLKDVTLNSAVLGNENNSSEQADDQTEKSHASRSVLNISVKLMKDICCGFAVLNSHNGKQILNDLLLISSRSPADLCRLAWLNIKDENWSEVAFFTQYLCSNFAVEEISTACKNIDLAWLTLGTELFSSVWRSIDFQMSLHKVTLGQLADFPIQRKHLCIYFWKIGVHLKSLKLKYRERLLNVTVRLESLLGSSSPSSFFNNSSLNVNLSSLMRRLEIAACALLPLSVPAKNCIDPVIKDEMNFNYLTNKKKLVENILGVLQSYQGVVSGQTNLTLFSNSKHPFIDSLLSTYNSVIDEVEKCIQSAACFRPRYTDFPSLVLVLNSFVRTVLEQHRTFSFIDLDHLDVLSNENIRMTVAQMNGFLALIQSFHSRTFLEYSAFPDIICPFFTFLNVLVATVSYKRFHLIELLNLRNLVASCNFPSDFGIKWNYINNSIESDILYRWCISEKTIMPKRLQKELIIVYLQKNKQNKNYFGYNEEEIIAEDITSWIKSEWSKWFQNNTEKQEKAYIYRKRLKHREGRIDEDDIKVQELLPDFSISTDDQEMPDESAVSASSTLNFISSEDLVEILHLLVDEKEVVDCDGYMALAWIMDKLSSCGRLNDMVDSKNFVYNLHALKMLDSDENTRIIDVYRKNNRSELSKCILAIKPLIKRIHWLKEKWPEMTVLDGILQRAERILCTSLASPQMQFSALLERLLGKFSEADLWEKVADRKHSLVNELAELRNLLINWRKMEVLCWGNLLEQVQTDCRGHALLLSWPLFEALDRKDKGDDEILAMTIEWIQNSTIIDFKARLMTAELLIKFLTLSKEFVRVKLCQRLKSVVAYFRQFDAVNVKEKDVWWKLKECSPWDFEEHLQHDWEEIGIIERKLATQKEPTEKQLHDFVKIMKYNDLNLWSVKMSAQKAHKQLFRLLKEFRLSGSELIAPLLDEIPPMLSTMEHINEVIFASDRLISCNDFYAKRALNLTLEIATHLNGIRLKDVQELTEFAKCCNDLICKEIQYEGDDFEKEKQQGRSLSERQKAVARLFRDSAALGLNSRKGLRVNAEQLTADIVAGMAQGDTMLMKLIRHGGASRNIVLKKFHKPSGQIDAKTISHLRGLTDFILNELNSYCQIITSVRETLKKMENAKNMLINYLENIKDLKQPYLYGQQWLGRLQRSKHLMMKFDSLLKFMRTKLENAPENDANFEEKEVLRLSGIQDTELSQLHKQHQKYDIILDSIKKTQDAGTEILEGIKCSLFYSVNCENITIWRSSDISHVMNIVKSKSTDIKSQLSSISNMMFEEIEEALGILHEVLEALANPPSLSETTTDVLWEGTEVLLIVLQNIYKQTMSIDFDNSRFMDILKQLNELLRNLNFDRSVEAVWNLCSELSRGRRSKECSNLEQVVSISSSLHEILCFILDMVENSAVVVAEYYMHFEAMCAALLEKGYVNPISKHQKEDGEKNGGELQSLDSDIAGLGDAKGEKDVGDSIDETGQVESLRGEEENVDEDVRKNGDDNTPLDIDDDFGGCLDDIDCEQGSYDDDNDGDEDNEPEADKEMGNVSQSEEDKLDPDLWDQNDDEEKELTDGSKGADRKTDDMVANKDEQRSKNGNDKYDKTDDEVKNADDDDLENVDEHAPFDNGQDHDDSKHTDEDLDLGDNNDDNAEDDIEHSMNVQLDKGAVQSDSDVEEETITEMAGKHDEQVQENFVDETKDCVMEELKGDEDEVFKGSAGGISVGETEDNNDKDASSDPNVTNEKSKNMEESDSSTETTGKGRKGFEGTDDDEDMNDVLENKEKDDRKCERKKELADDILDIVMQEALQSKGERQHEESHEFEHFDGNSSSLNERIVIDKSSVEEARNSKENRDQLKDLKNISVDENSVEMVEGDKAENRDDLNESYFVNTAVSSSGFQSSIIHATTDFYHLGEQSGSVVAFLDMGDVASSSVDAEKRWNRISDSISILATELSENLRMIIEPTVASRFEGDYRTGKRLNMRRLIPYIASGYRKDKIWLRRTKKAQHNYQILIAVDDSASMHDNQIKLKACQSVAMIEGGLRKLEIGQLAICKFGSSMKMISHFEDYGDSGLGGKLISELNFDQDRTNLVNLLKHSKKIFEQARGREKNNQMLIIVSDGRGVLADGAEAVKKAVANLHVDQVTVLFVAIDNGRESILDMKVAEFMEDGNVDLIPYLQKFPFPFYLVVRHIAMLPAAVGDAVRQWFELTARDL
uniref:Midasin n=1 Tax=Setaria digitata TaxID=48799 RepID=A0A915Q716_9BILA